MLQLLLVTHINREQMATTRAAAAAEGERERERERRRRRGRSGARGEGGGAGDGVERSLLEIDVFANTRRGSSALHSACDEDYLAF